MDKGKVNSKVIIVYIPELRDPAQKFNPYNAPMVKLTRYMAEQIADHLSGIKPALGSPEDFHRVGSGPFVEQFHVLVKPTGTELKNLTDEQIQSRFLMPAAAQLVEMVKQSELTQFGFLPVPMGVDKAAEVEVGGVVVRGVRAYDINTDEYWTRFDVLLG